MTQEFFNPGQARDRSEEMRFLSLQRVRGYWEGLIGPGGALPAAAALDPRGLLPALEDVFLADRIGEGLLRLRIAGRRVSAPAGMDMQGLPFSALFLPEARPALAHTVERVCRHHALVTMDLEAGGGIGRPPLMARLLLLPLADPPYGQPSVLGCLTTRGEIGRAPRRFAVTGVVEERLGQRLAAASTAPAHPARLPDFAGIAVANSGNRSEEDGPTAAGRAVSGPVAGALAKRGHRDPGGHREPGRTSIGSANSGCADPRDTAPGQADFRQAGLRAADLRGADHRQTDHRQTDFPRTDHRQTDLRQADSRYKNRPEQNSPRAENAPSLPDSSTLPNTRPLSPEAAGSPFAPRRPDQARNSQDDFAFAEDVAPFVPPRAAAPSAGDLAGRAGEDAPPRPKLRLVHSSD